VRAHFDKRCAPPRQALLDGVADTEVAESADTVRIDSDDEEQSPETASIATVVRTGITWSTMAGQVRAGVYGPALQRRLVANRPSATFRRWGQRFAANN